MWKCELEMLVTGKSYGWIERVFYAPTYLKIYKKVQKYLDSLVGVSILEQHIIFSTRRH